MAPRKLGTESLEQAGDLPTTQATNLQQTRVGGRMHVYRDSGMNSDSGINSEEGCSVAMSVERGGGVYAQS